MGDEGFFTLVYLNREVYLFRKARMACAAQVLDKYFAPRGLHACHVAVKHLKKFSALE